LPTSLPQEFTRIIQPVLIGLLVNYFNGDGVSQTVAYVSGATISVVAFSFIVPLSQTFFYPYMIGLELRASTSALVYRKVSFSSSATIGIA
jgi:hypothetical protein